MAIKFQSKLCQSFENLQGVMHKTTKYEIMNIKILIENKFDKVWPVNKFDAQIIFIF